MNIEFDVRPSAMLGKSKIEGYINEEIKFSAMIPDEGKCSNGVFGTKLSALEIEGVCDYWEQDGWLVGPKQEDLALVKEVVSYLLKNIRQVSVR
jgi:hypothetical protein